MAAGPDPLEQALAEIRERVEARRGSAPAGEAPVLPDLMRLLRARDSAFGKVAAIGTVNPRRGGLANNLIQRVKRTVARSLNWFVREQVEFNHAALVCVEETLEALETSRRAMEQLHGRLAQAESYIGSLEGNLARLREFENRVARNEVQFLKAATELQSNFHHRASLLDSAYRDLLERHAKSGEEVRLRQNAELNESLDRRLQEIEKQFWGHLTQAKLDLEGLFHREARTIRQRAALQPAASTPGQGPARPEEPQLDWLQFAERFRGSEDEIRNRQRFYLPYLDGVERVLDLGCGRGEFLSLLKDEGVAGRGIDLSAENVALCRGKGLDVEQGDMFAYLESLGDGSQPAIFCCQVVEHLPAAALPRLVRLIGAKLATGGLVAIETPNPACLAIFATHFYLDPTHTRPAPSQLLAFYLEEAGIGGIEVKELSPAVESLPAVQALPDAFRDAFFGGMDYAILGRKL